MPLGFNTAGKPAEKDEAAASPDRRVTDTLLDTLGDVVRNQGRYAFDTAHTPAEAFGRQCDAWVRHLLLGEAPPGGGEAGGAVDRSFRLHERRWHDLAQFLARHRREEQQHVVGSVGGLKSIVGNVLASLRNIIETDEELDQRIVDEVRRMHDAAQGDSLPDIRRQAVQMLRIVTTIATTRRQHHEQQSAPVREQLTGMQEELQTAGDAGNDPLTGINNAATFHAALDSFLNLAAFLGEPVSLVRLDVDGFGQINQQHGRAAGDAVLKQVAQVLTRTFLRKNDFLARLDNDEFAVLLAGTDDKSVYKLAQRLHLMLTQAVVHHGGQGIPFTCSLGFTTRQARQDGAAFAAEAARALQRARDSGGNQVAGG